MRVDRPEFSSPLALMRAALSFVGSMRRAMLERQRASAVCRKCDPPCSSFPFSLTLSSTSASTTENVRHSSRCRHRHSFLLSFFCSLFLFPFSPTSRDRTNALHHSVCDDVISSSTPLNAITIFFSFFSFYPSLPPLFLSSSLSCDAAAPHRKAAASGRSIACCGALKSSLEAALERPLVAPGFPTPGAAAG